MADSYELRDLEPEAQKGQDGQLERLLDKTSDEVLDDEIRRLQEDVDSAGSYLPRKSSESSNDRDLDMEEMVNRVSYGCPIVHQMAYMDSSNFRLLPVLMILAYPP
jgi:hypothetical protein